MSGVTRIDARTDVAMIGVWDGGGPVDVLVDEEVPQELRAKLHRDDGEYLLSVPTERVVVGGVEDYRSPKPVITGECRVATMEPGDCATTSSTGCESRYFSGTRAMT